MTPGKMTINVEAIPAELKERRQWVLWKRNRGTKVPYNVAGPAKVNDAATWMTFQQVYDAFLNPRTTWEGIGYVLSDDDGLVGVDLDDCYNSAGELYPMAQNVVSTLASYAETSPSGAGVKVLVRSPSRQTFQGRLEEFTVEVYWSKRFWAMTGWRLEDAPEEIRDAGEAIAWLARRIERPPGATDEDRTWELFNRPEKIPNGMRDTATTSFIGHCREQAWPKDRTTALLVGYLTEEKFENEDGAITREWLEDKVERIYGDYGGERAVPRAKKNLTSADYIRAMSAMGYSFRMNDLDETIEVNGITITDTASALIRTQLRDHGYQNVNTAQDCIIAEADRNRYHPIREWFMERSWDGEDWIGRLAGHFTDEQGIFSTWLRRWMVASVARAFKNGKHHPMLVLDGSQGLGKSYFVRWLAKPWPHLYVEAPIRADDKDHRIRMASSFIWEVAELGATVRRQDVEALKFFISQEVVHERRPYGHFDIRKTALTNFLGTVNNVSGFLADSTGSRRFITTTLSSIDWTYAETIDPAQCWAHAYALFNTGDDGELTPLELNRSESINAEYYTGSPVDLFLDEWLVFQPNDMTQYVKQRTLLERLHDRLNFPDRALEMHVANYMKLNGAHSEKRMIAGDRVRIYSGVHMKDPAVIGADSPFDAMTGSTP